MLDNIRIPEDVTRAVLYISFFLFGITLIYSMATEPNTHIPRPIAFVYAFGSSIVISLATTVYKNHLYSDFNNQYGDRGHMTQWHFDHSDYPRLLNNADMVSIVCFGLFLLFGIFAQLI